MSSTMKQHLGAGSGKTLCGRRSGFSMGPSTEESIKAMGDSLCLTCKKISGTPKASPAPPDPGFLLDFITDYDGKIYGSWPVFMTKGITLRQGTRMGRYGGVMAYHEGDPFVEKPDNWWFDQGWTIRDPFVPMNAPKDPS